MRFFARLEGALLIGLAISAGAFTLLGNYAFLMNPRFAWLTLAGAGLVGATGLAALLTPRRRPNLGGLAALVAMGLVVFIGKPYARDVNSLTLPDLPEMDAGQCVLDGVTYDPVLVDELQHALSRGEIEAEGQPLLVTGILMRSEDLGPDQFALMRPVSICCAADALLVGLQAEGEAPAELTGEWVHVYGRLRRGSPVSSRPRLRHGAIRFAVVAEEHIIEAVQVVPYERPRPKERVLDLLDPERFGVFARLAAAAGLLELAADGDGLTLLAPVDVAFDSLPAGRVDGWLAGRDQIGLRAFVAKHVLVGELSEENLRGMASAETVDGREVPVQVVNGALIVGGARVLFSNIQARNGLVHAIHPTVTLIEDGD